MMPKGEAPGETALRIYRQRHWHCRRQLSPFQLSRERKIARISKGRRAHAEEEPWMHKYAQAAIHGA